MKNLYFRILGLLCLTTLVAAAASVTLQWDPNCDSSVVGYRVYYGTNTISSTNVVAAYTDDCGNLQPQRTNTYHQPYTLSATVTGRTNVTVSITNLNPSVTYSFAVTAFDGAGVESDYSNEARYTVPVVVPPQPPVLRFNQ